MSLSESFYKLTTDRVLDSVEAALSKVKPNIRATGRIMALNSLENRVYEIELEDNSFVVTKFYRPGRWSEAQLGEEHEFLKKLKTAEIPVVAPLELAESKFSKLSKVTTLAQSPDNIWFAVFPKVRGRLLDELSTTQIETLGRYLGRIHNIGRTWPARHRLKLSTEKWGRESLKFILDSKFIDPQTRSHYQNLTEDFLNRCEPLLKNVKAQVVHGDCHLGNTLWEGEAPFFLDFDDMMIAPPVQDVWMILRGRDEESLRQRNILLSTYEQMNEFDYTSLNLIEPLRGLRIIHYSAWIARRWEDPAFANVFANFGTPSYWRSEMEALQEISQLIVAN
ncbi:MAG: serine/threonine protein kinase [Deltaproteobacteria bacterium]|nr:serine/threonine protein kinase [Deltaproteobacteria bacterium]